MKIYKFLAVNIIDNRFKEVRLYIVAAANKKEATLLARGVNFEQYSEKWAEVTVTQITKVTHSGKRAKLILSEEIRLR